MVVDSSGGELATCHTAELDPRLEYDQYLNAAVWDSRDGWFLLLPTPDHALAFQGGRGGAGGAGGPGWITGAAGRRGRVC